MVICDFSTDFVLGRGSSAMRDITVGRGTDKFRPKIPQVSGHNFRNSGCFRTYTSFFRKTDLLKFRMFAENVRLVGNTGLKKRSLHL